MIYEGFVASSGFYGEGGGTGYLCLPIDPEYITESIASWYSYVVSTEYETNNVALPGTNNGDAPCAVCEANYASQVLMIPGRASCPGTWSTEYVGYLMTAETLDGRRPKEYVCVDQYAEILLGSDGNDDGAQLYFSTAECSHSFIPCPPYKNTVPIACAVCIK